MNVEDYSKKTKIGPEAVPEYAYEAERGCLGCILIDQEKIDEVSDFLSPDDFGDIRHKLIYKAMLNLSESGCCIDILNIQDYLTVNQVYEKAGGQTYLLGLATSTPNTVDAYSYGCTIVDRSRTRALIEACKDITELAKHPKGANIATVIQRAEQKMFQLSSLMSADGEGNAQKLADVLIQSLASIKEKQENNQSGITGIPSGYKSLDGYLSGFHPGELIIIGARPGVGKTTFGVNIIQNIGMNPDVKAPVLFFSMEMPADQIGVRVMANMSRVSQTSLRNSVLDMDEWCNVMTSYNEFMKAAVNKVWIDDSQSLTPADLRTKARKFKQEHGLGMIVVDYLQFMHIPGYGANNRTQEVAACSKALKLLARELEVPVIALAQLNRGVAKRSDKRPCNSDLKESGAIEQDADVIIFISRENMDKANDAQETPLPDGKEQVEIIIGKQRNGPTGIIPMTFISEFCRFEEVSGNESVYRPY